MCVGVGVCVGGMCGRACACACKHSINRILQYIALENSVVDVGCGSLVVVILN